MLWCSRSDCAAYWVGRRMKHPECGSQRFWPYIQYSWHISADSIMRMSPYLNKQAISVACTIRIHNIALWFWTEEYALTWNLSPALPGDKPLPKLRMACKFLHGVNNISYRSTAILVINNSLLWLQMFPALEPAILHSYSNWASQLCGSIIWYSEKIMYS